MFQRSYSQMLNDSGSEARAREREAFDRLIDLLEIADVDGVDSRACIDAMFFLRSLWVILLEDIAHPDNALAADLRARIGSIGIWMLKRAEDIRHGRSRDLRGLIEINSIIRDGLK